MHLILSPSRSLPRQVESVISVDGDVLTYDGVAYYLSPVPEGGEGWPQGKHPFDGPITRVRCKVLVFLGDDAARDQSPDWADWTVTTTEGAVTIPAIRNPEPEPGEPGK